MPSLETGATFAGYRIEALAGRGGMGEVYRALQLRLNRPVALKLISGDLSDEEMFRERFQRESQLAASIDHPNVLPIYEAGEAEGRLFIAMRFVDGTDLAGVLKRDGVLEPRRAVRLVGQVAAALDAAHRRGLVHRDVKGGNVLVTGAGGEEHCYLTDFGLTKDASAATLTRTGHFVGTLTTASPEQIRGAQVDGRTDVYALGCVLYELLTGQPPYRRENEVATIFAHLNDPPPRVTEARPELPAGLDAVIAKALAKSAEDRYDTCGEMARAALAATGEPTSVPAGADELTIVRPRRIDPPELAATKAAATAAPPRPPAPRSRTPLIVISALVGLAALVAILAVAGVFDSGGSKQATGGSTPPAAHLTTVATIPVGKQPGGVALDPDGGVWVTNSGSGTVQRIDPQTNKTVGAPVQVGKDPAGITVGKTPQSVLVAWVALSGEGKVRRVELAPGQQPQALGRIPVGKSPEGVSLGAKLLWVSAAGGNSVQRVDRAHTTALGGPIPVGKHPAGIFVGPSAVWVSNANSDNVVRIDNNSAQELAPRTKVGKAPHGIIEAFGFAWVVNTGSDDVMRIDTANGKVVGKAIPVGRHPRQIAADDDALWVTDEADNTITRIDPKSLKTQTISVGTAPIGIAAGPNAIWVANSADGTVSKVAK